MYYIILYYINISSGVKSLGDQFISTLKKYKLVNQIPFHIKLLIVLRYQFSFSVTLSIEHLKKIGTKTNIHQFVLVCLKKILLLCGIIKIIMNCLCILQGFTSTAKRFLQCLIPVKEDELTGLVFLQILPKIDAVFLAVKHNLYERI